MCIPDSQGMAQMKEIGNERFQRLLQAAESVAEEMRPGNAQLKEVAKDALLAIIERTDDDSVVISAVKSDLLDFKLAQEREESERNTFRPSLPPFIRSPLDCLPPKWSAIYRAYCNGCLKTRIADDFGISEEEVKRIIRRTKRFIRRER